MDHLIRFLTAEGIEGSHVAESLDDAISFVEHLRNTEGATDVHLFRLTEVPLEFRTYYRVEVGAAVAPAASPSQPVPEGSELEPLGHHGPEFQGPPPASSLDGPYRPSSIELAESASANSRRLFSRS